MKQINKVSRKVTYHASRSKNGRVRASYQLRLPTDFVQSSNKRFAMVDILDKDTIQVRMIE